MTTSIKFIKQELITNTHHVINDCRNVRRAVTRPPLIFTIRRRQLPPLSPLNLGMQLVNKHRHLIDNNKSNAIQNRSYRNNICPVWKRSRFYGSQVGFGFEIISQLNQFGESPKKNLNWACDEIMYGIRERKESTMLMGAVREFNDSLHADRSRSPLIILSAMWNLKKNRTYRYHIESRIRIFFFIWALHGRSLRL